MYARQCKYGRQHIWKSSKKKNSEQLAPEFMWNQVLEVKMAGKFTAGVTRGRGLKKNVHRW
jgi:hypothetical protein